jgi:hypothetical protein
MGFEQRKAQKYYYRARRENGRVVKQYLGAGPAAAEAAAQDQARRRRRQQERDRQRELAAQYDALAGGLEPYWQACERLLALALAAHGYYRRRGEWRRRRASP